MQHRQICPNCSSTPARPLFAAASGTYVVKCQRCRLQFADRYPDDKHADDHIYAYDYFSPAIAESERRREVFAELLLEVEAVLNRKGRLLDVGAGDGSLLKVATGKGWKAEGTEISSAMIEYVRKDPELTIHHGDLKDIPLPTEAYDAIILNHVLEHVRNPRAAIENVLSLLAADGVVRVEVPNIASLSCRFKNLLSRLTLKRDPWKHYSTGHHFWFFTPQTLRRTLEGAGLAIIAMHAPAKQWGAKSLRDRFLNRLYRLTLWGGHIIVYGRRDTPGRAPARRNSLG